MQILKASLVAAFLCVPGLCRAQEGCLWLNAATAGGVLGGVVTVVVSPPNAHSTATHPANAKSSAGPMSANPSGADYAKNGMDDADCTFSRRNGSSLSELRIEVRTMGESRKEYTSYVAGCGARLTELKAIGNEALACSVTGTPAKVSEQVVGRVRDRAFLVRVITNDSSLSQSLLREKARSTAEQVAGNLF
jgi:hypothetical protein